MKRFFYQISVCNNSAILFWRKFSYKSENRHHGWNNQTHYIPEMGTLFWKKNKKRWTLFTNSHVLLVAKNPLNSNHLIFSFEIFHSTLSHQANAYTLTWHIHTSDKVVNSRQHNSLSPINNYDFLRLQIAFQALNTSASSLSRAKLWHLTTPSPINRAPPRYDGISRI